VQAIQDKIKRKKGKKRAAGKPCYNVEKEINKSGKKKNSIFREKNICI
jgi:hypothetical protein